MNSAYYTVGNEIFFNKFQAKLRSSQTNRPLSFNLFDEVFSKVSWENPMDSWDTLLDRRAQQIAAKGRPIILNFSGGSDSYTVYQVFKRNNIPLYAIHLRLKDNSTDNFQGTIDFLNTEKPNCKVFILKDSVGVLNSFYNTPEWIWNLSKLNFSISLSEAQNLEDHPDVPTLPDNYIQVVGVEKPRLKIVGDEIYSYQPDTLYELVIGKSKFEYFFIHPDLPELHIKQCHMLAKHIQAESTLTNKPMEYFNDMHDPRKHSYTKYCLWSGRFGDLANSASQKIQSMNATLFIPNDNMSDAQFTGRTETMFGHGVSNNETFLKNYLDGLMYVRKDSSLQTLFGDAKDYYSIRAFDTKLYKLS
jgi:hypothetical protein